MERGKRKTDDCGARKKREKNMREVQENKKYDCKKEKKKGN